MTLRELPIEEWDRLTPEMLVGQPMPSPEVARVWVAEEEGEIIGAWWIQLCCHIEPVWIRADKQAGTAGYRLFQQVLELLDTHQITAAYCLAGTAEVADYLGRLGLAFVPAYPYILCRHSPSSEAQSPPSSSAESKGSTRPQ